MNDNTEQGTPRKHLVHWLVAALLAALVLLLFFRQTLTTSPAPRDASPLYDERALQQLLTAQMPEVTSGAPKTLNDWRGQPLVINFWATWCPPCQKELPAFAAVARQYQGVVQFVGLGLDEREKLLAYARQFDLPYPTLVAGGFALGQTTQLGNPNRGLPFTLILDAQGNPVAHHVGAMSQAELERAIAPVVTPLRRSKGDNP